MPPFKDLDDLNAWLEQRCQALWTQTQHGSEPGTIADVWAQEVEALMPVGRPFDGFVEYTKRVSSTCLIHIDRNRYSVPASFANRPVSLRVYPPNWLLWRKARSSVSTPGSLTGRIADLGAQSMTGATIWR